MKLRPITAFLGITALATGLALTGSAFAGGGGSAPASLGEKSTRGPGDKVFLGTALSSKSRVWFTGQSGMVSEVLFGAVSQRQFNDMGFLITGKDKNGNSYIDFEKEQTFYIDRPYDDALVWKVKTVPRNSDHLWELEKTIITDPDSDALVIDVKIKTAPGTDLSQYGIYFFANPSIANSGGGVGQEHGNDDCQIIQYDGQDVLAARETLFEDWETANPEQRALAAAVLAISKDRGWETHISQRKTYSNTSCSILGTKNGKDGFADLFDNQKMDDFYDEAKAGNVMQLGQVKTSDLAGKTSVNFRMAVGFAPSEDITLAAPVAVNAANNSFAALEAEYRKGWADYLANQTKVLSYNDPQLNLAVMSIKTSEDKDNPGAIVAGLGTPWGEAHGDWVDNTSEGRTDNGYYLAWPRDMFQKATGLMAAGDNETALSVLNYMFKVMMQKTEQAGLNGCKSDGEWCPRLKKIGRFPQNAWPTPDKDGNSVEYWSGTQQDETALPVLLALRLYEAGYQAEVQALWPEIKKAAYYLIDSNDDDGNPATWWDKAPYTHQERWEEVSGLSPSTMASQIAGLVAAGTLSEKFEPANTSQAKLFFRKADMWRNHSVDWMFTTSSPYNTAPANGIDGRHYMRINTDSDPNDNDVQNFKNGLPDIDERAIVDAGFLQFPILGVMNPNDWSIKASLPESDHVLRQDIVIAYKSKSKGYTTLGLAPLFFRYNFDGYGNDNQGGPPSGSLGRGRLWPIFSSERCKYEVAAAKASGAAAPPFLVSDGICRQLLEKLGYAFNNTGFIPEQVWNNDVKASYPGFTVTDVNGNKQTWETLRPASIPYHGSPVNSANPLNWAMGDMLAMVKTIEDNALDVSPQLSERYASKAKVQAVTFEAIVTAPVAANEVVYVTGAPTGGQKLGAALLGNWEPPISVPLKRDTINTQKWTATVSLPVGSTYEFKFTKMAKQFPDNGFSAYTFESGGNRSLTVSNAASSTYTGPTVTNWDAGFQSLN